MPKKRIKDKKRLDILKDVEELFDTPLSFLSLIWLFLIIFELVRGLSPLLERVLYVVWFIFILDFLLEITIAKDKIKYLKNNWILVISLFLPALRILRFVKLTRIAKFGRVLRSVNFARLLASINKSRKVLASTLIDKKLDYVVFLTVLITFAGAAGMYYFENPVALSESGEDLTRLGSEKLESYGDALWWTSMIMTTVGSGYWPISIEGRFLAFILSLYALAIFGYITAAVASILIDKNYKGRMQ